MILYYGDLMCLGECCCLHLQGSLDKVALSSSHSCGYLLPVWKKFRKFNLGRNLNPGMFVYWCHQSEFWIFHCLIAWSYKYHCQTAVYSFCAEDGDSVDSSASNNMVLPPKNANKISHKLPEESIKICVLIVFVSDSERSKIYITSDW
jgi:hypothetical protein